ncbi:MAG: LCP family protein [Patescibacteria group bacterium]
MINLKVNLLDPSRPSDPRRKRKIAATLAVIGIIIGFALSPLILASNLAGVSTGAIITSIRNLGMSGDKLLKGEKQNRVNILFLGTGGEGHDGANLTDTIILASIRPSDGQAAMLSIPRDLSVPIPGYDWRRINSINAFAEQDKPGSGAAQTSKVIGDILHLPIHYYIRVDFDGFIQLINELGGVRVHVDRAFSDLSYPDNDYGFEPIDFSAGWQTMDGDRALKFARSRHGNNSENSDFARSRRQQKIMLAVRDKLFSFETLLRPSRVKRLIEQMRERISVNVDLWEALRLAKILKDTSRESISMNVLDDSPSGALEAQIIDGAFLLLPKNNDWNAIRVLAKNILGARQAGNNDATPLPEASVEIQNGTGITGLAAQKADEISKLGFTVAGVGNASQRDLGRTMIYDLSNGSKSAALENLKKALHAEVALSLPTWLQSGIETKEILFAAPAQAKAASSNVDFLVILGADPVAQ